MLAVAGCMGASAPVEPEFDGPGLTAKADGFTHLDSAPIEFGSAVTGEFTRDFQFFAYELSAREDAVLTAEVTRTGSSSRLDTTMFLYRLSDTEAPRRIAFDDDAGWGNLSRLSDFRLFSDGRYAIVIGTDGANGRGAFRLSLECEGEACESEPAVCNGAMRLELLRCLEQTTEDLSYESTMAEVAAICREDGISQRSFENLCDGGPRPSSFCAEGAASVARGCDDYLRAAYVEVGDFAGRIEAVDAEAEIDEMLTLASGSSACGASSDSGCQLGVDIVEYTGEAPSMETLFAYARSLSVVGPGSMPEQEETAQDTLRTMSAEYDFPTQLDAFLADHDIDEAGSRYGAVDGGDFRWTHGDCSAHAAIGLYPASRTVVTIWSVFCAG
ncbi:MAG: hypothetical protein AB7S26_00790 [Sandaracinaceae bacterium]